MLLQGCLPVIVEGQSDQFYLSGIKSLLIGADLINPDRELVFVPSGGAKGITSVAPIIAAKEEQLPVVLLDSDKPGKENGNRVRSGLYQAAKERVLHIGDFVNLAEGEVEDLYPTDLIAWAVSRTYRGEEEEFTDVVKAGAEIVPQIEAFAQANSLDLQEGWKVDLARQAKARLLRQGITSVPKDLKDAWVELFRKFSA
jgi:hypothetical protein